jgi:hypothetical protein
LDRLLNAPILKSIPSRKTWGLRTRVGSKMISGIGNVFLFQNGKQALTGSIGGRTSAYRVAQRKQPLSERGRKGGKKKGDVLRLFLAKKCFCEFRPQINEKSGPSTIWISN